MGHRASVDASKKSAPSLIRRLQLSSEGFPLCSTTLPALCFRTRMRWSSLCGRRFVKGGLADFQSRSCLPDVQS